jgi:Domain of unknown function (DUF4263)
MAIKKKPILDKIKTKIKNLQAKFVDIKDNGRQLIVKNKIFLTYNQTEIKYSNLRYFPLKKEDIVEYDYTVILKINQENFKILSDNIINPPNNAKLIIDKFRRFVNSEINQIVIGDTENKIIGKKAFINTELYTDLVKIESEEGKNKIVRFKNRATPFFNSIYKTNLTLGQDQRDYSTLLKEIIASGHFKQSDLIKLLDKLDKGESTNIVIEKQINKQLFWLIETIESILEIKNCTKPIAQNFGSEHFGFAKIDIDGPEHLMEKILTKYGKSALFGVPVLLNTDKYVINKNGLPNCQFDLILINHLADIEVVELKRPDALILAYDESRNKFYADKDLSIAISQAERYISTVYKENDEDYKIGGKKIKDFINSEVGGIMTVDICRPSALILIGSFQSIVKPYSGLKIETRKKVSKDDYTNNYLQAYKELKNSFKNINILTYSELLENARTRLELEKK